METKILPLLKSGTKKLRTLLICLIIIVTIIMSVNIFIFKDFGLGYKYIEFDTNLQIEKVIGYSKKNVSMFDIINEYLRRLENENYYIASWNCEQIIYNQICLVSKDKIDDNIIEKYIIDNLQIDVICQKVSIDNEIFYFKNNNEAENFIKALKDIDIIKYQQEDSIENIKMISSESILNKKIQQVKDNKAQKDAEIIRQQEIKRLSTSSRGTISRGEVSSYVNGIPLEKYTYISSYYGMRNGVFHKGIDFAAPSGTKIYAWKDGKVIQASWGGGYGNFIIIQHNDGTISRYAHCSGYACTKGQNVIKGQVIGYVGTTGDSTGNHLHFEILVNGDFVNPINYL